jgi:hypothetical protein
MKRFSEQLHKRSSTVKLRVAERRELRERVIAYMEYHPLPQKPATQKKIVRTRLTTEPFSVITFPWSALARWTVMTTVIVLLVVPVMAERSVPGDSLYAVKRFNEEVRSTLAFDTVQKVEWETERLNRRIAEARLLASEGRLTEEVEAEVAEAVRTQSQNVQKNIDVLRGEDADEATLASLAFETTLTVQSAALNEDENEIGPVTTTAVTPPSILAATLEETRAEAAVKNASTTIPAYDKLMARVEINTTRVYELRDSLINVASTEQIANITRRIEDIERSVAAAIELQAVDEEAARIQLLEVIQRTQKLVVFMTDIEVSQTVDIEKLVPVVLTDQEKQTSLSDLESQVRDRVARIEAVEPTITDPVLVEKVTAVLAEIETTMASVRSDSIENYSDDKATIEAALQLTVNLYTLLEIDSQLAESLAPFNTSTTTESNATTTGEQNTTTEEALTDSETDENQDSTVIIREPEVDFVVSTTTAVTGTDDEFEVADDAEQSEEPVEVEFPTTDVDTSD